MNLSPLCIRMLPIILLAAHDDVYAFRVGYDSYQDHMLMNRAVEDALFTTTIKQPVETAKDGRARAPLRNEIVGADYMSAASIAIAADSNTPIILPSI